MCPTLRPGLPGVAFTLIGDRREIFRSPECRTLAERVAEIFGRQFADLLRPIEASEAGMRLSGLIGRPGSSRGSRHETITFVNGRPVDSRTLSYALLEGCRDSVPQGRYPPAVIFFECDPAAVDVNVHPAKREVRFRSEAAVRAFLVGAAKAALAGAAGMGSPAGQDAGALAKVGPTEVGDSMGPGVAEEPSRLATVGSAFAAAAADTPAARPMAERVPSAPPDSPREVPPVSAGWHFVGLAHGVYALFETAAGIVLLDRRAAQERIWYERLREQFRGGQVPSQRLLLPVLLELDPIAAALLLDRREFLEAHGFDLGEFGRGCFRLEAVPDWLEVGQAEPFVRDLLGALREGRLTEKDLDLARDELARLAASRAVGLSTAPGEKEMGAMVADLFATRSPLTTPGGRPTFIELNRAELARRLQKS